MNDKKKKMKVGIQSVLLAWSVWEQPKRVSLYYDAHGRVWSAMSGALRYRDGRRHLLCGTRTAPLPHFGRESASFSTQLTSTLTG